MMRTTCLWLLIGSVVLVLSWEGMASQSFPHLLLPIPFKSKVPALVTAQPLKPEPGDDELRKLLKERYNAALREMKAHHARIGAPFVCDPPTEAMRDAAFRALETRLELSDKPEEHVRIRQEQFEWEEEDERMMVLYHQVGRVAGFDLAKANYRRLHAQIRLLQAKRQTAMTSPQKPERENDVLGRLLKERYNAAHQEVQGRIASFQGDRARYIPREVWLRMFDAKVESSDKPEDRIRIRQEQVEWAKEHERVIGLVHEARYSGVPEHARALHQIDLAWAQYLRVDAEIKLVQAKHPTAVPSPKKPERDNDELGRLLKERYNAAHQELQGWLARFQQDNQYVPREVWLRMFDAKVESSDKPVDHLRIRQEQVESAKEYEKVVQQQYDARRRSEADLQHARYLRLDAEIKLLLAKRRAAAGQPK